MSASRGDSRAELGSSCSPVRNKSIARLSLREEKGGCWAAAGSEKALSGSGQAGAARISRVSLGSLEASPEKPETEMCAQGWGARAAMACLGAGLLSSVMIFRESRQENGLNKEPLSRKQRKWPLLHALYWNSK